MITSLEELVKRGVLSPIDGHFAALLGRLEPGTKPEVLLAAALASRAVQRGHVCADLEALGGRPLLDDDDALSPLAVVPGAAELRSALAASPLVSETPDDSAPRPLVLGPSGKLYLYRYARYEQRLVTALRARAERTERVNGPALRSTLDLLFGTENPAENEQRRAALVAALSRLTVVSGGPGTGKTYTVSRILALLQTLALADGRPPLRILLLAPTGKAAQRVGESIEKSVRELPCTDEIRALVPRQAATIHRALGFQPRTPTTYRHHAENPLPVDVVLVDEASMIDIALMAKLVDAVPEDARLILLGDRDQLSSVEAGAILGDMYGDGSHTGHSPAFANAVREATGDVLSTSEAGAVPAIADRLVHFTRSRRFGEESDVGRLAKAVRDGNADAALAVLRTKGSAARIHPLDGAKRLETMLGSFVVPAYAGLVKGTPEERLAQLGRFRILCAHRKGPFGVEAVNAFTEKHLEGRDRRDRSSPWYDGRPVMITQNDYQLELWNGDLGVLTRDAEGTSEAHFPGADGGALRHLPPSRLPAHETVYAMTVHKSQGSQMEHVVLVLPEEASPILTRELVYTAVSRAEREVDIFAPEGDIVFRTALSKTVERASGIRETLWSR